MGICESSGCERKCDFEQGIKLHGLDITSLAILCKGLCVLGRGQAWDTCTQAERGVTIISHLNLNNVTLGRGGHALWSVPKKKNTHTSHFSDDYMTNEEEEQLSLYVYIIMKKEEELLQQYMKKGEIFLLRRET